MKQTDAMRQIWGKYGPDERRCIEEYARFERAGTVVRKSNTHDLSPEQYGNALLKNGMRKGWLPISPNSTRKR